MWWLSYLYEVDEGGEDGTPEHVVFLRVVPKRGQVE